MILVRVMPRPMFWPFDYILKRIDAPFYMYGP
jgi:hypothetical protein